MPEDLSAAMSALSFNREYVRPLATAENQFLQVLVDRFQIRRTGNGFELQVAFSEDSPSIWLRAAKRHLLGALPSERRVALQRKIEAFFASTEESYHYSDPGFPFRLGNGGRRVSDQISATTDNRVFFSDVTMTGGAFADQIDRALDSVWGFVAVGSRIDHLNKSWVKYEWRNFHNDLNSGRKPANAPFFAFVSGIDPQELPRPLRLQQAVVADPADPTQALSRLTQNILRPSLNQSPP